MPLKEKLVIMLKNFKIRQFAQASEVNEEFYMFYFCLNTTEMSQLYKF